ncbi:MAG: hypothetical protein NTX07_04955 [Solirubrobacterales bacterium]|nr:hypothetical protein [Solirubrobacterales bacterium]
MASSFGQRSFTCSWLRASGVRLHPAEGDMLNLVGPLGNGFPDPTEGKRPVLVAGGIGLAPVLALAELLVSRSVGFDLVLGFRSSEYAEAAAA